MHNYYHNPLLYFCTRKKITKTSSLPIVNCKTTMKRGTL